MRTGNYGIIATKAFLQGVVTHENLTQIHFGIFLPSLQLNQTQMLQMLMYPT